MNNNIIYCKNCGEEILKDFETCPYCKTPISQPKSSYTHQNKKFIPYYKQQNSVYQIYPFLSWLITIIMIVVAIYFFSVGIKENINFSRSYHHNQKATTSNFTISKNYQQIYNEYSQKLINAGPTSSISEMADILNEGLTQMAQYMYSSKGTDGQYSTYQSWGLKLTDVYMRNCR